MIRELLKEGIVDSQPDALYESVVDAGMLASQCKAFGLNVVSYNGGTKLSVSTGKGKYATVDFSINDEKPDIVGSGAVILTYNRYKWFVSLGGTPMGYYLSKLLNGNTVGSVFGLKAKPIGLDDDSTD